MLGRELTPAFLILHTAVYEMNAAGRKRYALRFFKAQRQRQIRFADQHLLTQIK